MLSHTVEYALRACIYLVRRSPGCARGNEIADGIGAPRNYLRKILSQLARAGIVESSRGPFGGFRLAPGVEHEPLSLVVNVFEPTTPRRCLLGHGVCGEAPACAAHERWAPLAEATRRFFAATSFADLLFVPAPPAAGMARAPAAHADRAVPIPHSLRLL